jgi:membrane-bound lytic murein transglycosylase MltF
MSEKPKTNVDAWLEKETAHKRKALENGSRYFDDNDPLTVNTLEAVYGQESSFGTMLGERGVDGAAGHFMLKKSTAEEYGLVVGKENDQRFDIDYASSAGSRYLKDVDRWFSKKTTLVKGIDTIAVKDSLERKKFVLAAFNGGQGRVAYAQGLAEEAGKSPQLWDDVKEFLELAGATEDEAKETMQFVEKVHAYEIEFSLKSPADKKLKKKKGKKSGRRCTQGHWVTIDDRPVFICD